MARKLLLAAVLINFFNDTSRLLRAVLFMAPLDNEVPPLLAPVATLAFLRSPRRRLVRPPKIPRSDTLPLR